jgi:hypothetical protein
LTAAIVTRASPNRHPPVFDSDDKIERDDGDWVESCTALVEHADGAMEILDWAHEKRRQNEGARIARESVAAA